MKSCLAWLPLAADRGGDGGGMAQFVLVAAILVLTITMLLRLYRYQARNRRKATSRRPSAAESPPSLRATPDSVVRWEVQMHELARDLKGEIDSKMVALSHLIRDADRAAQRLEDALEATAASDPSLLQSEDELTPSREALDEQTLREEVYMLADYGFSLLDISSRLEVSTEEIQLILRHRQEQER